MKGDVNQKFCAAAVYEYDQATVKYENKCLLNCFEHFGVDVSQFENMYDKQNIKETLKIILDKIDQFVCVYVSHNEVVVDDSESQRQGYVDISKKDTLFAS